MRAKCDSNDCRGFVGIASDHNAERSTTERFSTLISSSRRTGLDKKCLHPKRVHLFHIDVSKSTDKDDDRHSYSCCGKRSHQCNSIHYRHANVSNENVERFLFHRRESSFPILSGVQPSRTGASQPGAE